MGELARNVSPTIVQVEPACTKCHANGVLLAGLRALGRKDIRSTTITLILVVAIIVMEILLFLVWLPLLEFLKTALRSRSGLTNSLLMEFGVPLLASSLGILLLFLPVRAMACVNCGRVVKFRLGRTIPVSWQNCIVPTWKCAQCGHSLHGVADQPRCPECGAEFPNEWLAITRRGDPNAPVAIEVS